MTTEAEALTIVDVLAHRIAEFNEKELAWARMYVSTLPGGAVDHWERLVADHLATGWRRDPLSMAMHLRDSVTGEAPTRVGGIEVTDFRHVKLMSDAFRRCRRGESRFQLWEVPSQMQKSTTLRLGIVWALDDDPTLPIIYATYGQELAREGALLARDIALANPDMLRFQLRRDVKRVDRWMTDQGGGLLARGLGSGIAGFPAGLVIVDDPIKNWQEAHRPLMRDQTWGHITGVVRLRLRQGGGAIIAMARLHEDDPAGRMRDLAREEGIELEIISLPMLAEPEDANHPRDPLGRAPGEPIEPLRYDVVEAKSRAQFLGSYLAAALEQQRPLPEQGGEVLREWWKWTVSPPRAFTQSMSSWDTKGKDREGGDYVVGLVGGRVGGDFWVVDMVRGQFTQLQTKIAIAMMAVRHPYCHQHLVENSGNGPEVMTELRRGDPQFTLTTEQADKVGVPEEERPAVEQLMRNGLSGLIGVQVRGSKIVRARTVTPYIEAGNVHLIDKKSWALALVDEWAAFPPRQGGHDDIVDATSQLLSRLARAKAKATAAPSTPVPTPDPSARATPKTGNGPGRARVLN